MSNWVDVPDDDSEGNWVDVPDDSPEGNWVDVPDEATDIGAKGEYRSITDNPWVNSIGLNAELAGNSLLSGASGLIRELEDVLGTGTKLGESLGEPLKRRRNEALQEIEDTVPKGGAADYTGKIANMGLGLIPAVFTGPLGAASYFGLKGAGEKYNEFDPTDDNPEQQDRAAKAAGLTGLIDSLTAALPVTIAKGNLPFLKKLGINAPIGAIVSLPQTIGELYSNYIGSGRKPTEKEFNEALVENAKMGAVGAGLFTGMEQAKMNARRPESRAEAMGDELFNEGQVQDAAQSKAAADEAAMADLRQKTDAALIRLGVDEPVVTDQKVPEPSDARPWGPGLPMDENGIPILEPGQAPEPGLVKSRPQNVDEHGNIIIDSTSARTPEEQAALEPQANLLDENGNPIGQAPQEGGPVIRPYTQKGDISKAIAPEDQQLVRELKLAEVKRADLQQKALPVVPATEPVKMTKITGNESFPDVLKAVKEKVTTTEDARNATRAYGQMLEHQKAEAEADLMQRTQDLQPSEAELPPRSARSAEEVAALPEVRAQDEALIAASKTRADKQALAQTPISKRPTVPTRREMEMRNATRRGLEPQNTDTTFDAMNKATGDALSSMGLEPGPLTENERLYREYDFLKEGLPRRENVINKLREQMDEKVRLSKNEDEAKFWREKFQHDIDFENQLTKQGWERLSELKKTFEPEGPNDFSPLKRSFKGEEGVIDPTMLTAPWLAAARMTSKAFKGAVETAGSVKDGVKAFVRGQHPDFKPLSDHQNWLQGGKARQIGLGAIPSGYRKAWTYLTTLADKFPEAKQYYEAADKGWSVTRAETIGDFRDMVDPYFKLKDRSRVDEFMAAARIASRKAHEQGQKLPPITDAQMAARGLSPEEIKGVRSVWDTMDMGLDTFKRTLIEDAQAKITNPETLNRYILDVNEWFDKMKGQHYVPFSRAGSKYAVIGRDANGEVRYRAHGDNPRELKNKFAEAKALGLTVEGVELPKVDYDAYSDMPAELVHELTRFDPNKWTEQAAIRPPGGMSKFMVHAALTPGFDKNLGSGIADYIMSLGNFRAMKGFEREAGKIIQSLPEGDALRGHLQRNFNDMKTPGSPMNGLMRFLNINYLAGVPASGFAQLTQTLGMTFPQAIKELRKIPGFDPIAQARAVSMMTKAGVKSLDWLADWDKATRHEEAARNLMTKGDTFKADLNWFERRGRLGQDFVSEVAGYRDRPDGSAPLDQKLMFAIRLGDRFQRVHAFMTGWEIAKSKGLTGEPRRMYAEEFFQKVIPDVTKVNQPEIMRTAPGKVALAYKNYIGHQLRYFRNNLHPKDWQILASGLLATAAVTGIFGLPFGKETEKGLEAAGYNPRLDIRSMSPKAADQVLYGIPSPYFNVGTSASTQEFVPELDNDPYSAAGKILLGPAGDYLSRIYKSGTLLNEGKLWMASETIAPRFIRNAMKAGRGLAEGKLVDNSGYTALPNFTMGDAAQFMFGAAPVDLAKFYETKHTEKVIDKRYEAGKKYYKEQIAEAIQKGDRDKARDLLLESYEKEMEPSIESLANFMKKDTSQLGYIVDAIKRAPGGTLRAPRGAKKELLDAMKVYSKSLRGIAETR